VKHHLLEFLSPISLHHGVNFLAAIAVAWQERKGHLIAVVRKVSIDSGKVFIPLIFTLPYVFCNCLIAGGSYSQS
jgi:hypothetical protein